MRPKRKSELILIIDDNPDDLRLLGNLIKGQADIIFATSAEAGLFLAEQRQPDLIITDLFLKSMSGVDVCRRIKNNNLTQDATVIIVTSHNSEQYEVAALDAGAVDFITKPYRAPVVRARVKTHLSLSRHKNLLRVLADKDGLTEMYNRRYFEAQGRTELKRHFRQQQPLTLALVDIDHFKSYNDAYGHIEGDACLREVAQAIVSATRRPGEFVARYGGEEFAVVLPNANEDAAKKYGQWICNQVKGLKIPHEYSSTAAHITISAGLVTIPPRTRCNFEDVLASADSALYLAKKSGRNQYKIADLEPAKVKEVG